jgi:hypothetical protein
MEKPNLSQILDLVDTALTRPVAFASCRKNSFRLASAARAGKLCE